MCIEKKRFMYLCDSVLLNILNICRENLSLVKIWQEFNGYGTWRLLYVCDNILTQFVRMGSVTDTRSRNTIKKKHILRPVAYTCCKNNHFDFFLIYIRGSVHRNSRLKSNEMQQCVDIYLLLNYSTCFGRPSRPSSGVHKTVVTASGTDHTIWGASFLILSGEQASLLPR